MKSECADEVYFVFPRCEGVPFCVQAGKGLLSVNRCRDVCRNIRNVKLNNFVFQHAVLVMFVTAVCVLFHIKKCCSLSEL